MFKELEIVQQALRDLKDKYVEELRAAREAAYREGYAAGVVDGAKSFREVGVWAKDGRRFHTYRNECLNGEAMFVFEPKSQLTYSKRQP